MSIKSVLGRKRRFSLPSEAKSGERENAAASDEQVAAAAVHQSAVLGEGVDKAREALANATHRVSRRRAGLHELVGFTLANYYPCETLTKPLAIGVAVTMAKMLADPDQRAQMHQRGLDEIAELVKPEKPLFVLSDGLEREVLGQLRALGMTDAGPFMTGRPNVPLIVKFAVEHKLTILRYDGFGEKQILLKAGVETGLLAELLREHKDALDEELGVERSDQSNASPPESDVSPETADDEAEAAADAGQAGGSQSGRAGTARRYGFQANKATEAGSGKGQEGAVGTT